MRTEKRQTLPPLPITTDSRGTEIKAGLKVAYSVSGDINVGAIIELKRNNWIQRTSGVWHCDFLLEIEHETTCKRSKIKNPNSFVII